MEVWCWIEEGESAWRRGSCSYACCSLSFLPLSARQNALPVPAKHGLVHKNPATHDPSVSAVVGFVPDNAAGIGSRGELPGRDAQVRCLSS